MCVRVKVEGRHYKQVMSEIPLTLVFSSRFQFKWSEDKRRQQYAEKSKAFQVKLDYREADDYIYHFLMHIKRC